MTIPEFWRESWTTALANHLWQSTVIVVIAWLLALALRKNHARMRYWVWLAASVKFLLPFSLLVAAGGWLRSLIPAAATAQPAVASVTEQAMRPFAQTQIFHAIEVSAAPYHASLLPIALLSIWICGAFVMAGRIACGWGRVNRAKRAAFLLDLEADVPVLSCPTQIEPGIFGVVWPVLLLPEGILERLSAEQLQAVLAHEMCHVRRRDNLTFALHMLVETLFWFHPAVWWIGSRLIEERERACDEAVVQAGSSAQDYAEGILNVCRFYVESPVACVAGVTGADLKQRIVRIVGMQDALQLTLPRKVLLACAALIIATIPLAAGLAQQSQNTAQEWEKKAGGKMAFDVASVRLDVEGIPPFGPPPMSNVDLDPGEIYGPTGGRFFAQNKSLRTLIAFAYKMNGNQQLYLKDHVPSFVLNDRFDVQAKTDNPNPTKDQMRLMARSMLEDRFKLKVHMESLMVPVLALVPANPGKFGPQLRMHRPNDPVCAAKNAEYDDSLVASDGFPTGCGSIQVLQSSMGRRSRRFGGRNVPMRLLAEALVAPYSGDSGLSRPVIDATGFTGNVDFTLELDFTEMEPTNTPDTSPNFFEELEDQLGLKLKQQKGPAEFYIVDHVERLSDQNHS